MTRWSQSASYNHHNSHPHHLYVPSARKMADAESFLLLTLPGATITQEFQGDQMTLANGELAIECVSLPIPPEIGHQTANPFSNTESNPTHDLWLVLRVGHDFENTLVPENFLNPHAPAKAGQGPSYTIRSADVPGASLLLTLQPPHSVGEAEDLQTFETLLQQYGGLRQGESALTGVHLPMLVNKGKDDKTIPAPVGAGAAGAAAGAVGGAAAGSSAGPSAGYASAYDEKHPPPPAQLEGDASNALKGKLVLVDQDSGSVMGELDAPTMAHDVHNMDPHAPVFVDFGMAEKYIGAPVEVTRIPPEELNDSTILWTADKLSRGILWFGDAGASALRSGAGAFVKRTVPRPEPTHFSDATKKNLDRTYRTTAGASRVTRSTLNSVHNVIAHMVEKKGAKGQGPAAGPQETTGQRLRAEAGSAYNTLLEVGGPALGKLKAKAGYGSAGSSAGYTSSTGAGAGAYGQQGGYAPPAGAPPLPPRGEKPPLPTSEKPGLPPRAGEQPPAYGAGDTKGGYGAPGVYGGQTGYAPQGQQGQQGQGQQQGYYDSPAGGSGAGTPRGKRPMLNKGLLALDSVLSSLEAATNQLIVSGTSAASQMAGHRYGAEAGEAVAQVGGSARNAVLVYVDVRGMGRRAILKSTARGYVKARLRSGEKVELQGASSEQGGQGASAQIADISGGTPGAGAGGGGAYGSGKQDIVVGVPQLKK